MAYINYKKLSTDILNSTEGIEEYTDALNTSIETFKHYFEQNMDVDNIDKIVKVRPMFVRIFRNIEGYEFDEAVEVMSSIIRKEFSSAKRKERYLRDLAKKDGKEYVSELVKFGDIDETKEIVTEKDIDDIKIANKKELDELVTDFDVEDFLNTQVPERFGETVSKPKEDTKQPDFIPLTDMFNIPLDNDTNDRTRSITNQEYEKPEPIVYPELDIECENMDSFTFEHMYGKDKNIKWYIIEINLQTEKNKHEFNMEYLKPLSVILKNHLDMTTQYFDRQSQSLIDMVKYSWEFMLTIATDQNINDIIDILKTNEVINTASIRPRQIRRLTNNSIISKI